MFEIGFWELVVVAVVALCVLGPERLPVVAKTAGKWLIKTKQSLQALTKDFSE